MSTVNPAEVFEQFLKSLDTYKVEGYNTRKHIKVFTTKYRLEDKESSVVFFTTSGSKLEHIKTYTGTTDIIGTIMSGTQEYSFGSEQLNMSLAYNNLTIAERVFYNFCPEHTVVLNAKSIVLPGVCISLTQYDSTEFFNARVKGVDETSLQLAETYANLILNAELNILQFSTLLVFSTALMTEFVNPRNQFKCL